MSQIQSAALILAGVTVVFVLILLAWKLRSGPASPTEPKLPKAAKIAGESRLPKLSRKPREEEVAVEMAPERLARISRKTPLESLTEPEHAEDDGADDGAAEPVAVTDADRALVGDMVAPLVAQVHHESDMADDRGNEAVVVRLVPQVPPRDAGAPTSWMGGCPRLPDGMDWPEISGDPAVFLAQIHCADLPRELWRGDGPREGWLAYFLHPRDFDMRVLHVSALGSAMPSPVDLDDPDGWFSPHGGLSGDLRAMARKSFPEWPVDLVAVRPGDDDPLGEDEDFNNGMGYRMFLEGFDVSAPRHHPFNWESMLAMVTILETQIATFWRDLGDGPNALHPQLDSVDKMLADWDGDRNDPELQKLENRRQALVDLIASSRQVTLNNREAKLRVEEIIAIVRESAGQDEFSSADAASVMDALRAIHWMKSLRKADPQGRPGAELIETMTLPVTQHHPDAALWADKYHSIWFDLAKHAYVADPEALSPDGRAFFEAYVRDLIPREMAGIGHVPFQYVHDFDETSNALLLELPSSGLMGWQFGDVHNLVLSMRGPDLAAGDFDKLIVQVSN